MKFRELMLGIDPPCPKCFHVMLYMGDGKPTCPNCMAHLIVDLYSRKQFGDTIWRQGARPHLAIQDELT